jgi:endo-1,4-beta-xylanase
MIAQAKQNGQLIRGHSCVSYDEIPSWVVAGNFNPTQYHNILVNHCATVVCIISFIVWRQVTCV